MKGISIGSRWRRLGLPACSAVAITLYGGVAFAQQPAVGGTASGGVTAAAPATAPAPAAAPAATPAPAPAEAAKDDDHMMFVNHFAVGYFGVSQLPIAAVGSGLGALTRGVVNAPVIGMRYWFQPNIGIDAGIGFGYTSGSTETVNGPVDVSTDKPSAFGFAVHAGVPIAFAHAQHFVFELVPEANVGFTSGTIKQPPGQPDESLSGFRLDIGARIGAEIHFGFIGVPQLALQGSVGAYFRREAFKWSQGPNSASDGTTSIASSVQSDPWALFANNISALYYF